MLESVNLWWVMAVGLIMILSAVIWAFVKGKYDISIGLLITAVAYSVIMFIKIGNMTTS